MIDQKESRVLAKYSHLNPRNHPESSSDKLKKKGSDENLTTKDVKRKYILRGDGVEGRSILILLRFPDPNWSLGKFGEKESCVIFILCLVLGVKGEEKKDAVISSSSRKSYIYIHCGARE